MMRTLQTVYPRLGLLAWAWAATVSFPVIGAEYFLSPAGNNAGDGSASSPWGSLQFAIDQLSPGDTLFVRGGTYNVSERIVFSSGDGGLQGRPVNIWAYQEETPVFDFASMTASLGSSSGRGIQLNSSVEHVHIRGLTVQHAKDNGIHVSGNNNRFERLTLRYNADSGLQLSGTAAHNLVLNTDSYENFDPHNGGENADGFAAKFAALGPGNKFYGSRAWGNSDDGWDLWEAGNGVEIRNSWAFANGVDLWNVGSGFNGDGNGYKLGQTSGPHVLSNLLVWNNRVRGIDVNGNGTGVAVCNSTVYNSGRNWQFDETVGQTQNLHVLTNNISVAGTSSDTFLSGVDATTNSWNGISADVSDFLSVDDTVAKGPRRADGGLPVSDFLRLANDSNLIDAGTNVGLPFNGTAPDLGAFESGSAPQKNIGLLSDPHPCGLLAETGDFNGDGSFDCLDVDALVSVIATASNAAAFDMNGDGRVDLVDLDAWLTVAGAANLPSGNSYLPGDANLDGAVDGLDFLSWNASKFTSTAAWCAGDFNADGLIDGQDFLVWNGNKFRNAGARQAVPEQTMGGTWVWLVCFLGNTSVRPSPAVHATLRR